MPKKCCWYKLNSSKCPNTSLLVGRSVKSSSLGLIRKWEDQEVLRSEASKISSECHHGCKTTLKEAVLTPPRLPTCHLKRHQTRCDKLTWEASGSCLPARQPCHLILLWHGIQETRGLNPTLTSQAESVPKITLHDETILWQLVFVYVVAVYAVSVTLLDQKCNGSCQ